MTTIIEVGLLKSNNLHERKRSSGHKLKQTRIEDRRGKKGYKAG